MGWASRALSAQSAVSHWIETASRKYRVKSQEFTFCKQNSSKMETKILKTAAMLLMITIVEMTSSRPQSNTNGASSDCGRSYCEQVPNYPSKTILKLLDKTNILPGTFDSIERQGKRSLKEEERFNINVKNENVNLINLIKR